MALLYGFLFIVIGAGSIGIFYVYQYNSLQHSKTKIEQAEYLIDEALRSKYDILVKADNLIKEEIKEKDLFKDLATLKDKAISNFDLDRKLAEHTNLLAQIKTDYSVLAENKAFKTILNENKKEEEKLQAAKSYYNKYTSEFNDLVRSFPSNIVAKLHGFEIKAYFDGKNLQDDIVDDFKL